jgi:hypothetical protein
MGVHYLAQVKQTRVWLWSRPNSQRLGHCREHFEYLFHFVHLFGHILCNVGQHCIRILQRWWRRRLGVQRERHLAVMMAFHARLGQHSPLATLDVELVKRNIILKKS